MTDTLNLVHESASIQFSSTHYVFVERIGNIPANAPEAWRTLHTFAPALAQHNKISGAAAFYKPTKGVYRAAFLIAAPAEQLPERLSYDKFPGGTYTQFTLSGPYDQLPEAHTRSCGIVADERIALRDDFYIEHYLTDPTTTPAEQNVTAILFPIA